MGYSGNELDVDLDIDLESGGTSEEDSRKVHSLSCEYSRSSSESLIGSKHCSCSYQKPLNLDEIPIEKERVSGKFNLVNKSLVDKVYKHKKQKSTRPPKPPRPPQGPSLNASDIKFLRDIAELNLKRKKMDRLRSLRKIKKEKVSSISSNVFALLVTVIFFLVIIFQGLLGSRV